MNMYSLFIFLNEVPLLTATNPIQELTSILLWVARTLIILFFGSVGTIKVVKGTADENPTERGLGFAMIGGAGVVVAMTFAIENLLK